MKVSHLSDLLGHFGRGIESAGGGAVAKELDVLSTAMRPFADRTVADFVKFLGQCEEYQRTGVASGKKPMAAKTPKAAADPDRISRVVAELKALLEEARRQDVAESRIDAAVAGLSAFSKADLDNMARQLEIQPRPKTKPDAIKKIRDTINMQAEISARVELSSKGY
ncbi:hypothetical protein [Humisphaera borealis]|uniref:Uncharacterized protein n=1 Tax=Humisphaera borealis TaxID=2807512 RepID=A0A7M2X0H0_9BACT|nr:hypothetical protein [Humisphaera borealis]QOV91258.1 hypothetical protein IPV69_07840 [Humisphaera borealis]